MNKNDEIEYLMLREDIRNIDIRTFELIRFSVGGFAALVAFGIAQASVLITLIPPLVVLYIGYSLVLENAGAITRRAAYIRAFLEIEDNSPKYETRLRRHRESRPQTGGRKLHGDVVFWLFILSGWAAIILAALRFHSAHQRYLIASSALIWLVTNIYASYKRNMFEAGGNFDTTLYSQFSEVRDTERNASQNPHP